MAEAVGDEWTLAIASHTMAAASMRRDPVGSRPLFLRGYDLARKVGDQWLLMAVTCTIAQSYLFTDDIDEAERWIQQTASTIEAVGDQASAQSGLRLGLCALARAEFDRCVQLSDQAASAARRLGDPLIDALANVTIARVEIMTGRAEAAFERMSAGERTGIAKGALFALTAVRVELARARAALGDLEEAHELLEAVVAGGADGGWHYCLTLLASADLLRTSGDLDRSRARANEALELSRRLGMRSHMAAAQEVLARLAIASGEWTEAEGLLHEALGLRVEISVPLWTPQTFDAMAMVAAGLESYSEAARLLGAADRARVDLGLVRWPLDAPAIGALEQAISAKLGDEVFAARAAGAAMSVEEAIGWVRRARGTRKRPAAGWEALTPTELQVVALVAQGMSNPQIAGRLFISPGTAKIHVGHIFDKLGVHSRSELAALAARRGS